MTRTDPPTTGSELETLVGFLDFHRETLRMKCAGLDAEQLSATLAPSTMTLGGMLAHLAYVEDWWFNVVYADNPPVEPWSSVDWEADGDRDWHLAAEMSPEELWALFEDAVASSEHILHEACAHPSALETLSKREFSDPSRRFNLRWVLVHLVEEYSRHNGHADLLRESIDGTTGE